MPVRSINEIRIATLPAGRLGGAIGVTFAPGKKQIGGMSGDHDRDLSADLDAIARWNAAAVITLMTDEELSRYSIPTIGEEVRARFMEWHHLPINDFHAPDAAFEEQWPAHSARLRSLVAAGNRLLVHCRGGLGRSGMVAARLLAEMGADPEDAISAVRRARGPTAVETRAQEDWVRGAQIQSGPIGLDDEATRDRAVGTLLGLAVGDAVGTSIEFSAKPVKAVLSDMVGAGPFGLEPGQWTDDTAMALALGESLLADPSLDPSDLMRRFVSWYRDGTYSCTGRCFDIGNTTAEALHRFERSGTPFAGSTDPKTAGNGSIMRLAPVAIRHWRDRETMLRVARDQSRTTHAADEAVNASEILADLLALAIRGATVPELIASEAASQIRGFRPGQGRQEVRGTGYVVASLHAALWAVSRTSSFRDAVLLAANLGEDADTTAAVAGQLAGALYGADGIPSEWLHRVAWRDRIEALAGNLYQDGVPEGRGRGDGPISTIGETMTAWSPEGRFCSACGGEGRMSPRYPAAICRDCEKRLVDWAGRQVKLANTSMLGTGIQVSTGEEVIVDQDTPIFVDGMACWAREARFGGIVVQPIAAWLKPPFPYDDPDRPKTIADFGYDGRAVLDFLVERSPWGSADQAIASLSIFAHPDVVAATGRRALFRTIRGMAQRGKIVDGVMHDDNYSPAIAFEWSTGFKRKAGSDLTCCHLYAASGDPDAYTDLRNLFYAPSFISKLTDSQAASLPSQHALNVLRYRAFVLYGYCGPGSTSRPAKPDHYDALQWADTVGAGLSADDLEQHLRSRLAKKPKDRITKSAAQCGWAFSGGRPDPLIAYAGQ